LYDGGKESEAREFIVANRHMYTSKRTIRTIEDLANSMNLNRDRFDNPCAECQATEELFLRHITKELKNQLNRATEELKLSVCPFPPKIFDRWFGKIAVPASGSLQVKSIDGASLKLEFLELIKGNSTPDSIEIEFNETESNLCIKAQVNSV
jgi:hypothetical protein